MAMEGLARFSEREAPRRAVDEAHAELGLQRGDAADKLRGLQAQRLRRPRIGSEIDHFGEEIEVVEVLNRSHAAASIILFATNMNSIRQSVQEIIAKLFVHWCRGLMPPTRSRRLSMFLTRYLPFVGRLMIGLPFAMSGLSKLGAYGATTGMISAVGLPFPRLAFAVAVATELGGGLLLIGGYRARYAAAALTLFSLATAISF